MVGIQIEDTSRIGIAGIGVKTSAPTGVGVNDDSLDVGESFLDVPKLGLVEFLGKDCWYTWGDKKILWGLENVQFTPDPRYSNLCHLLNEIGFKDSDDVKNVLNGTDLDLMGKTYLLMNMYDNMHGVNKLIQDMKTYDKTKVVFKDHIPQPTRMELLHNKIDAVIKNGRN